MKTAWFVLFIASVAQGATITTSVTVFTQPPDIPAKDCYQTDPNSAMCSTGSSSSGNSAYATATAHGDPSGQLSIFLNADRFDGFAQASASATAIFDDWFVPTFTGTLTSIYSYSLGSPFGDLEAPTLDITQEGGHAHFEQKQGSGEIDLTSQIVAGQPFEVTFSLTDTLTAPDSLANGEVSLSKFLDPLGNRVTFSDSTPVPEPSTWVTMLGLLMVCYPFRAKVCHQ